MNHTPGARRGDNEAPVERVPVVTIFHDVFAETAREIPLDALLDTLRDPPARPHKKACELFVGARFGTLRTEKNSLRSDENVLALYAISGDYDGEQVPLETARDRLEVLDVKTALYTSPSHTPDKPRWRVVAPLSAPHPRQAHPRLAARLNAALGGILSTESRTLSQSYYFGRINGHEYTFAESGGRHLDLARDLDDLIPPEAMATASGPGTPEPDEDLRDAVLAGSKGKVYPALRSLTARFVGRGMSAEDVIAALQGLLAQCQWQERDPKTWQKRFDDIQNLVTSAARKYADPRQPAVDEVPASTRPPDTAALDTEMQIATAFVLQGAEDLRYVAGMDWFVKDGPRWRRDDKLVRFTLANELCRAAGGAASTKGRARIESNKTAAAVVNIARPDLIAVPADFDTLPYELNTPHGVIDLRYGTMRRRAVDDLFMHCTAVAPDSRGIAGTVFAEFLTDIACNDTALVGFLQTMLGATLFASSALEDHWLAFLVGSGRNGKGTLIEKCAGRAMGTYARRIPAEVLLADDRGTRHPTEIANLVGARLAYASEIDEGRRWNESRLKELSGGDKLSGRFMRQDLFEFTPSHRLVIYANHRPLIQNPDPAFRARLKLVPFNASFVGREDTTMPERMTAELPLILGWMIAGAAKYWEAGRLANCAAVDGASGSYFEMHATFDAWLEERCRLGPGYEARAKELYTDFKTWKQDRGEGVPSQTRWGETMATRFTRRQSHGVIWCGIGLQP